MAYLRTRFLLTLVLSIASLSVFAVDLVIPTNSDYRFRDINSVSIGPALDETNFLEVYVGANGFITVTGIEFPKAELTGCQVDSASLLVNSTSIDNIPGSLVTVVGKNSDYKLCFFKGAVKSRYSSQCDVISALQIFA